MFANIYTFLDSKMETPTNYGWFHLLFVGIVIAVTVFLCIRLRDADDKTLRRVALVGWLIMLVLEIYKQYNYTGSVEDGKLVWDYQWYAFPYQLCSTPLYVLPFIAFMKDGRVREAFVAYMSFFSLFGGVAVFFYPNDVFVSTIGINIQTMIHHGLQIVLGIYFAVHSRQKYSWGYFLRSIPVFVGLLVIAMVANIAVYHALVAVGNTETFNMFFISPYFECTLPVLSAIYPAVWYPVFFVIYALGFVLVAFILFLIQYGIIRLTRKNA